MINLQRQASDNNFPTIVYALTSNGKDVHSGQTFVSSSLVRHLYPKARIILLVDELTHVKLQAVNDPVLASVDQVLRVETGMDTPIRRNRALKTTMRLVLEGPFVYLDSDTLPIRRFDELFSHDDDFAAVQDYTQELFGRRRPRWVRDFFRSMSWRYPTRQFVNGGVMYMADRPVVHEFSREWNRRWRHGIERADLELDQPSLNSALDATDLRLRLMSRDFNCQVKSTLFTVQTARIFHYFKSQIGISSYSLLDYLVFTVQQTGDIDWNAVERAAANGDPWVSDPPEFKQNATSGRLGGALRSLLSTKKLSRKLVSELPEVAADVVRRADMTTVAQLVGTFGQGGAERVAINLANALNVTVFRSLGVSIGKKGDYTLNDSGKHQLISLNVSRGIFASPIAVARLRALIASEKVDIIHAHGEKVLLICVLASMGLRIRPQIWFTWHVPEKFLEGNPIRRRLLTWALLQCDQLFAASREIVEGLRRFLPASHKVSVFRNFVPETPVSRAMDSSEPLVLWYARLVSKKNPIAFIRAVKVLRDEGLRFRVVLAGGGHGHWDEYERQVRNLVDELGLQDILEMPGWIGDINPLLMQAAIGVQSSDIEGLSMSLLEQMMAGLSIVATDVGDTATAIRHEETGLLIPPRDEEALTAALRRLIMDRHLRLRLGNAARSEALCHFSNKAASERVASLIVGGSGKWHAPSRPSAVTSNPTSSDLRR